ncbi:MAG: protein kinase [Elusimicrobiota bacterium]|jgi:tRNA A-37 threonylcarbamoyl transferase component Bud32
MRYRWTALLLIGMSGLLSPAAQARPETAAGEARDLVQQAARSMQGDDPRGALGYAQRARDLDPRSVEPHIQMAAAYLLLQDAEAAVRELDAAIALGQGSGPGPGAAAAFYMRADLRRQSGDPAGALADMEQAAKLNAARYAGDVKRLRRELRGARPRGGRSRAASLVGIAALLAVVLIYVSWRRLREEPAGSGAPEVSALRIGEPIGSGGMGTVYKAYDEVLQRWVAAKRMNDLFRDAPLELERFLAEARTVAALKHPGIVDIYGLHRDGADLYLVFELVQGENLHQVLARRGPLPPRECLRILAPVCVALDYAHGQSVVHRDIKPANIMLEGDSVKVMDFGIARRTRNPDCRTRTDVGMGTPYYMAPEQEFGDVSREADTYALGVCLYEMLTGRYPFSGPAMQRDKISGHVSPAPELAGKAPGWEGFFNQALHPNRDKRFHSAGDLLAGFKKAAA